MKREIKFRGKSIKTGKWIEGNYIALVIHGIKKHFIFPCGGICFDDVKLIDILVEVIPETVGQFTGLKDKNGKEIYEGDIIKNKNPHSDAYSEMSIVEWHKNLCGFTVIFETIGHDKMLGVYENIEVIGNKFDNPELLEQ